MGMLEQVLSTAASSGIVALVFGYWLNTRLERFKADISKVAYEHQVRFGSLHQKRTELLEKLNELIVEAEWATRDFVSIYEFKGDESKEGKYAKAMTALTTLFRFFDKNRIYLSDDLCDKIDKFVDDLRNPTIEYSVYLDISEDDKEQRIEKHRVWTNAYKHVRDNIPPARKELEAEFRKMLGAA